VTDRVDALRPAAGAAWVRDQAGVLVVHGEATTVLEGVDAVVWSRLALSPTWPRLIECVAALLRTEGGAADEHVRDLVEVWRRAGLLEPVSGDREVAGG
jgi:hypothetical protein